MTTRAQTGDVPRILDISRTVARGAERAPTGIDRAERAYLAKLLELPAPVFGLVRTPVGFLLLDRCGLTELQRALSDPSRLGKANRLSRFVHRRDPARAKLETLARRFAIGRADRWGLGRLLQRNLPAGTEYLNVGHSNLTERVVRALSRVPKSSSTVVLHDCLPLTHPQYNRPVAAQKSERMVRVISENADRVVHISKAVRVSNDKQLSRRGRIPPGVVAPLGVRVPLKSQIAVISEPYFLAVGTLEPRKNLGFLLDLWEEMASHPDLELPGLVLAGARGWESDAFFERLIRHSLYGANIRWIESPDDAQLDALLRDAHGLLFPSHVEGQGLPPLEAASIGVPVICQPLPSLTEFLGSYAHLASCDDLAGWIEKIKGLLAGGSPQRLTVPDTLPTWKQHFAMVFESEMALAAGGRADKGSAVCV